MTPPRTPPDANAAGMKAAGERDAAARASLGADGIGDVGKTGSAGEMGDARRLSLSGRTAARGTQNAERAHDAHDAENPASSAHDDETGDPPPERPRRARRLRRRLLKSLAWTLGTLALLVVLFAALLYGAASTERGTRYAWQTAVKLLGGRLSGQLDGGALATGVSLRNVAWRGGNGMSVTIDRVAGQWALSRGPWRFTVDYLHVGDIDVRLVPSTSPSSPATLPRDLRVPLRLDVRDLRVATLRLHEGASTTVFSHLVFRARSDGRHHEAAIKQLDTPYGAVHARATLDGVRPFALSGELDYAGKVSGEAVQVTGRLGGSLQTLSADLDASGMKLTGHAHVEATPFAAVPLRRATLSFDHVNPRAFAPGAPLADLAVRAQLVPVGEGGGEPAGTGASASAARAGAARGSSGAAAGFAAAGAGAASSAAGAFAAQASSERGAAQGGSGVSAGFAAAGVSAVQAASGQGGRGASAAQAASGRGIADGASTRFAASGGAGAASSVAGASPARAASGHGAGGRSASAGFAVSGAISIVNAQPGAFSAGLLPLVDAHADVRLDAATQRASNLNVRLVQGATLSGGGALHGRRGQFDLKVAGLDLNTFQASIRPTRLSGPVSIRLNDDIKSVVLDLADPGAALRVQGKLTSDPARTSLSDVRISSGAGRVDLSGALKRDANASYTLKATLTGFDPLSLTAPAARAEPGERAGRGAAASRTAAATATATPYATPGGVAATSAAAPPRKVAAASASRATAAGVASASHAAMAGASVTSHAAPGAMSASRTAATAATPTLHATPGAAAPPVAAPPRKVATASTPHVAATAAASPPRAVGATGAAAAAPGMAASASVAAVAPSPASRTSVMTTAATPAMSSQKSTPARARRIETSVTGTLTASGKLAPVFTTKVDFQLAPTSVYDGLPLTGAGTVQLAGTRILPSHASLSVAGNHVELQGSFGAAGDRLRFQIAAPQLDRLGFGLAGQVAANGDLTGTFAHPDVVLAYKADDVVFGANRLGHAEGRAELHDGANGALAFTTDARALSTNGLDIATLSARLAGTRAQHTFTASATGKIEGQPLDLSMAAHGRLSDGHGASGGTRWDGTITQFQNRGTPDVSLQAPLAVSAGAGKVTLGAARVALEGALLDLRALDVDHGRIHSVGTLTGVSLARMLALRQKFTGTPASLKTDVVLDGDWNFSLGASANGYLQIKRRQGDVTIDVARGQSALGLSSFVARAAFDGGNRLSATLHAQASRVGTLDLNARAGLLTRDGNLTLTEASPLGGTLKAEVPTLATTGGLFGPGYLLEGRLGLQLTLGGTLARPNVSGELDGDKLAAAIVDQGLQLKDGVLRVALSENLVDFKQVEFHGASGTLRATGQVRLDNDEPDLAASVVADKLELFASPERRLSLSGSATLANGGNGMNIDGHFTVDRALFDMPEQSAPTLGDDVVIVRPDGTLRGGPPPVASSTGKPAGRFAPRANVNVDLGHDFRFRGHGADLGLAGAITATSAPGEPLRAVGNVRVTAGSTYTAFGRKLGIENGFFTFNGPVSNPSINILAMRRNQQVEAGVQVTGTAQSPSAKLVSEPNVPDTEKLSWLLFGHGTDQGNNLNQQSAMTAALALLGNAGGKRIAQTIGLDEFSIGSSEVGLTDPQVVILSKAINSWLVLGYEQGLQSASNAVKATLNLTRYWSVTAYGGTFDGVDLSYTRRFDRIRW